MFDDHSSYTGTNGLESICHLRNHTISHTTLSLEFRKLILIDLIDDAVVIVLIIKDSVLLEAIYQFSFVCQSSVVTAMCALLASAAYIAASTVFIS